MSLQYDSLAGFDPSSLTQVTAAQLLQMINQIKPLSNIGGIVFQPGTSLAAAILQGTNGSPDVSGNPRFSRYIWLNTFSAATSAPTPYFYNVLDSKWYSITASPLSLIDANIATAAAINVTKLATGTARWLLRTNSAGTFLEFINPNAIFATGDVPLTALDVTGAPGSLSFMQRSSGGVISWAVYNPTGDVTNLAVNKIFPGTNNYILQTVSGVPVWVNTNAFLQDLDVALSKLAAGGAVAGDYLYFNGTNWSKKTPKKVTYTMTSLELVSGTAASPGTFPSAGNKARYQYAHGQGDIGANPFFLDVMAVCLNANNGYSAGDLVNVGAFSTAADKGAVISYCLATTGSPNFTPIVNIAINNAGAGNQVIGADGTIAAILGASWGIKFSLSILD